MINTFIFMLRIIGIMFFFLALLYVLLCMREVNRYEGIDKIKRYLLFASFHFTVAVFLTACSMFLDMHFDTDIFVQGVGISVKLLGGV